MKRRAQCAILLMLVAGAVIKPDMVKAASLVWQLAKNDAVSLAQQQGKKILLLAGRAT